ncbi:MAG: endopeptidase La [Epsilonproteobacteria bacterium]|nr:endopeptidase La [Campylobacterota bacterium]
MNLKDYDAFPDTLPLIVEDNMFLYPFMITPIFIEDEAGQNAVRYAIDHNKLLVVAVSVEGSEEKNKKEFYEVAIAGNVMRKVTLPDGKIKVLFQGLTKIIIKDIKKTDPMMVLVDILPNQESNEKEINAVLDILRQNVVGLSKIDNKFPVDLISTINENNDANRIADLISSVLRLTKKQSYELLKETNIENRLYSIIEIIKDEIESYKLKNEITQKVNKKIEKINKDYFLKEQIKAIQKELGDNNKDEEVETFRKQLESIKDFIGSDGYKEVKKQIDKFARMHSESGDAAILQTYIEQIFEIPFGKLADDTISVNDVEKQLNSDHYSLQKAKDRISEYFAVKEYLTKKNIKESSNNSTVLCFVGPPGVGKTSLANSIASALKRPLARIALGGLEDVNELRGHRRTYVGAMPGRLVTALISAGKMNPVVVLDEIDKLGQNHRGDPTAVMLEILDPEQNSKFRDHYINFEIDLSHCIFVATANNIGKIPAPLRDRMEFIEINSYTPTEKFHIAKEYLIPQELGKHGLSKKNINLSDATINLIIEKFTREAGVRNLRRVFNKLFRKTVKRLINDKELSKVTINNKNIEEFLDNPVFEIDPADKKNSVGIVNGLAWTSVGGDVLKIEAVKFEGKGNLSLTGNMGDVMKESAKIAHSVVKGLCDSGKIKDALFKDVDIHMHIPEGATPKDGPSAGIAMALTIASILSGRKVYANLAMTGELTLTGKVLPIGGLKEKLIAASKANMKRAFIPLKNYKRDLKEIPEEVLASMEIIPVTTIDEVIELGLLR